MNLFIAIGLSYLLGSIPFAYLISDWFYRKDIREEGSGNVGVLNFFRITQNKLSAALVLLLDVGKAFLAIWMGSRLVVTEHYIFVALAVIIGHIFPVWLGFQGGRGLATLAGIFLFLKFEAVVAWLILFGVSFFITRKYILSTVSGIILINLLIGFTQNPALFFVSSACSLVVLFKYYGRLYMELSDSTKGK